MKAVYLLQLFQQEEEEEMERLQLDFCHLLFYYSAPIFPKH